MSTTPLVKITIDGVEMDVPQGSMIIEAADNANMVIAESCSAGSYRCSDARQMRSHYIGIAFNDHDLALLGDLFLCHIQAVQDL